MKNVSSNLDAHLNGELQTLAGCIKLTLIKYQPRIIAISNANPGVVTTRWDHGFVSGDTVRLWGVRGMTAVNRLEYQITVIDPRHFSIGADTTALGAYTHKGVAQKVIGYTGHVEDLVFDGVTYKATIGYVANSIKQAADLSVDSFEAQSILQNAAKNVINSIAIDGISDEDLIAGRYDNARVETFLVNYEDLTMGRLMLPVGGRLGESTLHRGTYSTEMNSKAIFLQEVLGEKFSNVCRADLGDEFDGSEPEHHLQPGFGCKIRLNPPFWKAETAYTVRFPAEGGSGGVVNPSVYNGRQYIATTEGTSGINEPVWNTTIGGTTADGSVVWTTIDALTKRGIVYTPIDRRRFIDEGRDEQPLAGIGGVSTLFPITAINTGAKRFTIAGELADNFPANARFNVVNSAANDGTYTVASATNSAGDTLIVVAQDIPSSNVSGAIVGRLGSLVGHFTYGVVTFITGFNRGIGREVRSFSLTSDDGSTFTAPGLFEFFEAFPFDIYTGDEYEVHAGCDKSLVMCKTKFDNVNNRRAEDNIPGFDSMMLYPDAK